MMIEYTFNAGSRLPQIDNLGVMSKSIIEYFEASKDMKNYNLSDYAGYHGMHPKKLQRLLRDEGTSFSEIVNIYRAHKVMVLLCEAQLPVNDVAKKLGYSCTQALGVATQRWYGESPRSIKKSNFQIF